ncbi:acyl-CoA thioesterase/BAAT N-terminal domain-containing protein, partial [Polaribacter sp.]|uniref:acyl-CoA thioesterase/BAAT N-terminal domain-containing protein n=1 Tax=Polaribacter sp. TaxID=1920175 RepID=UPI003EEF2D4D
MKIVTILKKVFKIISLTVLLILIPSGLFYSCISSYPSSRVNSQLLNSDTKPCNTLEIKTAKKGTLQVTPDISYADDKVAIHITGLQPFQIGSLKLSVTDSKDIRWESVACFQANEYGEINPENQAPIAGGSY